MATTEYAEVNLNGEATPFQPSDEGQWLDLLDSGALYIRQAGAAVTAEAQAAAVAIVENFMLLSCNLGTSVLVC